jgi:hypothetical protein
MALGTTNINASALGQTMIKEPLKEMTTTKKTFAGSLREANPYMPTINVKSFYNSNTIVSNYN